MYDILIAGGGPAGLTAAIYSGRAGWSTLLLDPMGGGGQAATTDMIYNYPGFPGGVSGAGLMESLTDQAKGFGTEIEFDEVEQVTKDNNHFRVKSENGEYLARSVIFATGTSPRKLNVPGEDRFLARGISFCATCDGPLFKGRVVAVVGGGDSALTEAEFLTRFAGHVLLIHRRDQFRAGMAAVRRVSDNPNIRILFSTTVEEVKGDGTLSSLVVRNTKSGHVEEIPVDGLFLYVGSNPNVAPVRNLVDLSKSGYVEANEDMSTKTPGLFVAGDVREKLLRQVSTAVGDGANAAWSAERYLLEQS